MSIHTKAFGLLALPVFLLAGCDPAGQENQPRGDADAAEAPPTQRPATGMDEPALAEWDTNGDRSLDREEFAAWADDQNAFDDWFTDEGVDFDAIGEDIHSAIDVSGDGTIDENDWNAAVDQVRDVFGGEDPGTWSEWDTNADGELDTEEFRQAAEQRGLRDQLDVDGDGEISEQDVETFYFQLLDENGNGRIEESEWQANRDAWFSPMNM